MTEGPGATRCAQKLKTVIQYKIIQARIPSHPNHNFHNGSTIVEVISIGKEVFLIYQDGGDEVAMRLHFGMNGTLVVEKEGVKSTYSAPWRKNLECSILMNVSSSAGMNATIKSYSTTVSFVSPTIPRNKYARNTKLDVCSPRFKCEAVVEGLHTMPNASDVVISEAILNQDYFPGVGNIIKVEALHRANMNPLRPVSTLSKLELEKVVMYCRNFSMHWLKKGVTPTKLVYNLSICGTCHKPSISMQKIGGHLPRVTFWCQLCQPLSPGAIVAHSSDSIASANITPCKRTHPDHSSASSSSSSAAIASKKSTIFCPQHRLSSITLRRVRKQSANQHRIFYACKQPSCQYFNWADTHFPTCRCSNSKQRAVLRISKTASSGGKWFFSCCREKQGCGFFLWADYESHLSIFGTKLTPLL